MISELMIWDVMGIHLFRRLIPIVSLRKGYALQMLMEPLAPAAPVGAVCCQADIHIIRERRNYTRRSRPRFPPLLTYCILQVTTPLRRASGIWGSRQSGVLIWCRKITS